jgi:type II secretory pathway pseudopilin PulG
MNEYLTVTLIVMIVLAAATTAAITSLPLQVDDVVATTTNLNKL